MFNIGDKIVHPMHGAGVIECVEEKDFLGEKKIIIRSKWYFEELIFPFRLIKLKN